MPDDLVCIQTFAHRYEAEMARSLLEGFDVPSFVAADDAGGQNPLLLAGSGGARLIVRSADADRARQLLDPGDGDEDEADEPST